MAKAAVKERDVSTSVPTTTTENPVSNVLPDFLGGYSGSLGTENIDASDVNIPRLKLGQSMSPEVKDNVVKDGDLFHSITKQVLIPVGQTGLVIPVAYAKEYILWRDRKDGGGIFARARRVQVRDEIRYAWDKPNSTFEHKINGQLKVAWRTKNFIEEDGLDKFGSAIPGDKDSLPAATAHFNYILCLPEHGYEMVAVSFNRTSAKKAKDWNAMLKMGNVPMFARQFKLGAVPDQNNSGDRFFNFSIAPAGFVQSQDTFDQLRRLHEELGSSTLTVDWSDEERGASQGGDDPEKF